jgi:hypothetical protein
LLRDGVLLREHGVSGLVEGNFLRGGSVHAAVGFELAHRELELSGVFIALLSDGWERGFSRGASHAGVDQQRLGVCRSCG